ncbi:MAG: hypothetical protein U0736_18740 [Gemmataceae bacterium]
MTTRSSPVRRLLRLEWLEARETPATLFDNGTFAVVAETRAGIAEPAVPVYYRNELRGSFNVIEGYQRASRTASFPLVWSDVIANTYSRLTYQKADGTSASLASSLIGSVSFRSATGLHLVPTVSRVDVDVSNNVASVRITAAFGADAAEVVTYRHPLSVIGRTMMTGSIAFTPAQDITLDSGLLGKDALRLLTVSTMFTGTGAYDTSAVRFVDSTGAAQRLPLAGTSGDSHLFATPYPLAATGATFTAIKEPGSTWYPDSPTLQVNLIDAAFTPAGGSAGRLAVGLEGWRQNSPNPNDDSVSLWPEVLSGLAALPAGSRLDVQFQAISTPPQALPGPLAPPVLLGPRGVSPTLMPTFAWSPMLGADHYDLLVTRLTPAPGTAVRVTNVSTASYTPTTPLPQGWYRAYVRVFNAAGQASGWSAPLTFRIDVPTPARPVLAGPIGATTSTPTFTWAAVDHAASYDLLVNDATTGASFVVWQRVTGTSYSRTYPLAPHAYRWSVRAINAAGEVGPWSAPASITVAPDVLTDLLRTRHAVTYAPRNFNPNIGLYPTAAQINADLLLLRGEGFRTIITWSLDNTLSLIPARAKALGFSYVVAGIYWYDQAQLDREYAAALAQQASIDAYIVGNEGLEFGPRYSVTALTDKINDLRTATGKPVGTCETGGFVLAHPEIKDIGDFLTVNLHPWWAGIRDPAAGAQHTANEYAAIQNLAPAGKPVFVRESWWPSSGDPAATAANQTAYFRALAASSVPFAWGEAFDQPYKAGVEGVLWGLHTATGVRKPLLLALAAEIRDPR